ncbi:SDR family NAD(P)-dependent oxidoreductase [Streptomyces europaeiscabiei]|uniref:SDR family NAD(P)-dependent oxidoreductase n=1 Tax=Streptomyces europaeiscabiei TaxID=146819 RepID=UPI000765BEC2|nr:SDR family NAD(P)-dependent oxidoreductase [Streptomyces europaeiscabiei]MDX3672289.1 SDR family NAD(P)-dependent oxidoreductase [Streptomyces europaeiscabiei]
MNKQPPHDRVVLVTGAAAGIGAAIADAAVGAGHRVLLTDVDETAAQATAARLGKRAAAFRLDIRDPEGWTKAFDAAEAEFGPVDILVNNAGIITTGKTRDLSLEQHRAMVEVNLLGTMTGVYTAIPRMTERGSGHIVTICSMSSFLALPGYATYGGTKHGLRAFHHAVALEERHGPLDFTIIHPAATRTEMLDQELNDPTAITAFAEKSVPPAEVAKVVVESFRTRPTEVVFPTLAGRVQQVAGAVPQLIRLLVPIIEAKGRRERDRLLRAGRTRLSDPSGGA